MNRLTKKAMAETLVDAAECDYLAFATRDDAVAAIGVIDHSLNLPATGTATWAEPMEVDGLWLVPAPPLAIDSPRRRLGRPRDRK